MNCCWWPRKQMPTTKKLCQRRHLGHLPTLTHHSSSLKHVKEGAVFKLTVKSVLMWCSSFSTDLHGVYFYWFKQLSSCFHDLIDFWFPFRCSSFSNYLHEGLPFPLIYVMFCLFHWFTCYVMLGILSGGPPSQNPLWRNHWTSVPWLAVNGIPPYLGVTF
jgi:hypothetical protein